MSELSIKINIAGRIYPLTIQRDEEETIRKAAKQIEQSLKSFQENYAVRDKQDLLAMTALQMATQLMKPQEEQVSENLTNELTQLNTELDQMIKGAT
ncbi:MAG: cell division protein ZapA [Flavobacteriales bacterium]|nr:cell division protein ZapA [Flavobacteriales bacterium]